MTVPAPPPNDSSLPYAGDERRGIERRVEVLERQYMQVMNTLTRLEMMQVNVEKTLDSRHEALSAGQALVLAKIDGYVASVAMMSTEADKSPMGRALLEDLSVLRGNQRENATAIRTLQDLQQKIDGGLTLMKWVGGGTFVGIATAIFALLKAFGVVGASGAHP